MRVRLLVTAIAVLAAAAVTVAALAEREAAPLPGLPKYTAGFQSWTKLNFEPLPNRGGSAHAGVKTVYVNKSRAVILAGGKQRFPYPNGTIVLKTGSTQGFISLVAVGRKIKGSDRAHADWQFIEWTRTSARARFTEVARGEVCYSCHVGAKRTDWIFTRAR